MEKQKPDGFLVAPEAGPGPGVLVLHPWWGLNDTIKTYCSRLADAGFTVFAPDLYHGKIAKTIPEAESLSGGLDDSAAKAEIKDAAAYLLEQTEGIGDGLAVIGFSLGAYYAVDLSAADPENIRSVVVYYGSGPADFGQARAKYLGHFAENDSYEPLENVNWLKEGISSAGRSVTFHMYPGVGHWFSEPDVTSAYNEDAAELAWTRTLAFLKE